MNLIEALKALDEGKRIKSPLFQNDVKYIEKSDESHHYLDDSNYSSRSIFHVIKKGALDDLDDFEDNFSVYEKPLLTDEERSFLKNLLQDFVQHTTKMKFDKEGCDAHVHLLILVQDE